MKCPNCGLVNPGTAIRCDCGYDFTSGTVKDSHTPQTSDASLASLGDRLVGQFLDSLIAFGFFLLGFAVSAVSESLSSFMMVLSVVFFVGYVLFADGLRGGQSYGKKVMKTS